MNARRLTYQSVRLASSLTKNAKNAAKLDRPIGLVDPPTPTDNDGVDRRSLSQKKDDLMNYDKHMARRKELEAEFGRGLDDVRHFRITGGKFFAGPSAYFRADKALYMPNIWGKNLKGEEKTTTPLLNGHVSIVRLFGSVTGEQHTKSYTDDLPLDKNIQMIDINTPDSFVKEQIVKLFTWNLRKQVPPEQYERYFISRKGISKEIKRSIQAENPYAGYVYLVDRSCKIRWASSGLATSDERANLSRFAQSVLKETAGAKS